MNKRYVFPAIYFLIASYLTRFYETVMNHPFITFGDFNATPLAVIISTIVIYGIVTIDAVLDTVAARSSAYPVPVNNAGFVHDVHEHTSDEDVIDIEAIEAIEIPVEESKSKPEEVPEPIFMEEYEQPPYEDVPR